MDAYPIPQAFVDEVLDDAVNNLGVNAFDFVNAMLMLSRNRPGLEPTNDNNDPFVLNDSQIRWHWFDPYVRSVLIPFKQRVEARGDPFVLTLTAIAWNAYQWRSPTSDPGEDYAEIMMACLDRLRDRFGIVPDYVAVYNEPDLTNVSQETPAELFRGMEKLQSRLQSGGFSTRLRFPDTWLLSNAPSYFDQLQQANPSLLNSLGVFSFHGYTSLSSGLSTSDLNAVRDRAKNLGIPAILSEWWEPNYHPPHIHQAMTQGDVAQYQPYVLAGPNNDPNSRGLYRYRYSGGNEPLYNYTGWERAADWYEIYQYSAFIRPGDVRITMTSTHSQIKPVAFEKANGRQVIVIINEYNTPRNVSLANVAVGTFGISITSPTQNGEEQTPVTVADGDELIVTLPANSVSSIYPR